MARQVEDRVENSFDLLRVKGKYGLRCSTEEEVKKGMKNDFPGL